MLMLHVSSTSSATGLLDTVFIRLATLGCCESRMPSLLASPLLVPAFSVMSGMLSRSVSRSFVIRRAK